jgi:cytoskeletal protein RodZ
MSALGESFRTARESQGLTLADVAARIHIRSAYLAAIEAEDWKAIGPPVYVRGFVRGYARCLGLDADAIVAALADNPASSGAFRVPAPARAEALGFDRAQSSKRRLSPGALAGALVAFALVLFVGYQYVVYQREQGVPTAAARPVPVTQPAAQPQPAGPSLPAPAFAPSARRRSEVKIDERASGFAVRLRDSSWLRVTVDGKVTMEGLYPSGTTRTFAGRSATVRVGNAGGVDISVDGKDLGPMGGLGDVAERSFQL